MSRGGEVSADHEFKPCDQEPYDPCHGRNGREGCHDMSRGECARPRSEHPPAQAPAPPTDPARKPADEDEAAIALARKIEQEQNAAAIEAVQFAHRMKRPKPGLVDKSGVITALLPYTRELIAYRDAESTARAQGRQAGAEEMREACAKDETIWPVLLRWAEKFAPSDVTTGDAHRLLTALKAALRALPIPESRS